MSRSVSELREAAVAAGWDTAELPTEILGKLAELEQQAGKAAQPRSKAMLWLAIIACIVAATAGTAYFAEVRSNKAQLAARDQAIVERDAVIAKNSETHQAEIMRLREANAAQLASLAENMKSAIAAAELVSKNNANAADTNSKAAALYMNRIQELLAEVKTMRETAGASPVRATPPMDEKKP